MVYLMNNTTISIRKSANNISTRRISIFIELSQIFRCVNSFLRHFCSYVIYKSCSGLSFESIDLWKSIFWEFVFLTETRNQDSMGTLRFWQQFQKATQNNFFQYGYHWQKTLVSSVHLNFYVTIPQGLDYNSYWKKVIWFYWSPLILHQ